MEVELFACHLPVHVDGNDGFVLPLGSWLYEKEIAVEDEGCHGVASGTQKESASAKFALVYVLVAHDILQTHLI